MSALVDPEARAFAFLRGRLARRRFSQLEPRLRIELGLLALLLTGFVFWQVRGPLAGLHARGGTPAVLVAMALAWAALALLTAGVVAVRHARRLRLGPLGPAWLALPATPHGLARHLAWDSRLPALWVAVPAAAVWAAGLGLVPGWGLALLALPLGGLLGFASGLGARLGQGAAGWGLPRCDDLGSLERTLAVSQPARGGRSVAHARWVRRPPWLALCAKDLKVTRRVGGVGRQLVVALFFWLLSVLAWRLAEPPHFRELDYVTAFVLVLLGSAALGEWLVALSGSDPFATVRVLPLGVSTVWGARFAWAVLGVAVLLLAHALAARGLAPHALRLFLGWVGGATLAIAALAVNYGVTLFPRADLAQRLLGLSLGLAVAASLMIPLMGWLVLLSAVLHSARRLPRWSHLEEA